MLGKKLVSGNLVRIQYVVSQGMLGNVSGNITQTFTSSSTIGGGNIPGEIVATQNSTGGADRDTIDSIKFKAPKFYSTQNRAVTATDYTTIIQENPSTNLCVNLEDQTISVENSDLVASFEIDSYKKICMINGFDDIDFLINNKDKIEAFEKGKITAVQL